jgi:sec1 family domain-containing protein 1
MDPSLAANASLIETDDWLFLDPRARGGAGGQEQKARRQTFQDGMVFMVGGAGYAEYGNLGDWAGKSGKRVWYGGTEILDPEEFLDVCARLGAI